MSKFILTILVAFCVISIAYTQEVKENKSDKKKPILVFEKVLHDFGNIEYDGNGTCEFVFKNTGKEPLILSNVQASCGCTIPEWSKEPIKKGTTSVIKVKYDTKRQGNFTKTITVTSNAKNQTEVITIKGNVLPSPENTKNVDEQNSQPVKTKGLKTKSLEKKEINISLPQKN